ncbi:MAG: hypothetical protein CMO01_29280 [Thalassobius sp.]|nr:hypothetical protein [Thalassovita sp.]
MQIKKYKNGNILLLKELKSQKSKINLCLDQIKQFFQIERVFIFFHVTYIENRQGSFIKQSNSPS